MTAATHVTLARPPEDPEELWHVVNALWGVALPDIRVCEHHVSPFAAFSDAYFAHDPNWALWYGSRGCLAADSLITVNRGGNSRQVQIGRFVAKHQGLRLPDGSAPRGAPYNHRIPTFVQRGVGAQARLGMLGTSWESGVKTTYEVVTDSGRRIRATAEHPLLVDNEVFTPISDVRVGDEVAVNVGKSSYGRTRIRYARDVARFHPRADRGMYWRHRMVAEARLNGVSYERFLDMVNTDPSPLVFLGDEHVHHLNGDSGDNRMENLVVVSEAEHKALHGGLEVNVLDQIGGERITSVRRFGEEPTYDLTMADAPNNYIANGFVVHNTGKSYMLALLALTKAALLDVDVVLLGGSMAQSINVREHVDRLLRAPNAPRYALAKPPTATEIKFAHQNWIRPIPASQTTVRGPHPAMTLLDEIDEMEYDIYTAAQGQAMKQRSASGAWVPEMTVASSTWQNPEATFTKVYREAQSKGMPVHSWCFKETLKTAENPHGWMDPEFIERKRRSVPAEMFRVEYELGEPSGMALAFDMASLEQAFSNDIVPVKQLERGEDTEFIYEQPDRAGVYAAGADWAKEKDFTVIVVVRVDCDPWRTAYVRRFNRRPWPYMIAEFERVVKDYQAVSAHDATGLGNVVHDLVDERTAKVVMVGKDRTKLLTDYITAVEQGRYALARPGPLYSAHRSVTVDEVFGSSTWKSHLADEVAACAIAHRAAVTQAPAVAAEGVQRGKGGVKWIEDLDGVGSSQASSVVTLQEVGVVTVIEEVSDVGVFWLE